MDFSVDNTVNVRLFLLGVGVEKCGRIGGPSPHRLMPLQLMAVHSLLTLGGKMVTSTLLALSMQHFHQ